MKVRCELDALVRRLRAASSSVSGFDPVDLVEDQHLRLRARLRALSSMRIGVALDAALGVDQHQDDIGILGAAPGGRHHRRVEPAARLEDAGRVDEDDLRIVVRGDAAHDGARRLHLVGDDRDLRADQLVDQRRLAGVRRADQRDEAGTGGPAGSWLRCHVMRLLLDCPDAFAHKESGCRSLLGRAAGTAVPVAGSKPVDLHATR